MDRELPAVRLLELPVRLNDIPLGRAVDVLLDLDGFRTLGLEILCGDDVIRYLPLAAATVREDEIAIASALLLFDERDLAWYRRRSTRLSVVRGGEVRRGRQRLGTLGDVVVGRDGAIRELVVETDGGARGVPPEGGVTVAPRGSASAA